ncbi:fibronectin type III domain-containing protein 9 [Esox lucius]|uniref:Fibronectin type-III domain-containing protein n=1 Tax=Esox lucius TaxID=8010 RepID=A0AAY5L4T5_ESOLU|nr:fibronectin type III domain-containing protein 9 [Esox lucius]XP_034149477.1 fibronectin type III domain-containing protein 9 [Esox lucius]
MVVTVRNVSSSTATVSWPWSPGCVDTFYSVMYHPNWNSLLMGYTRRSFLTEERIPVSRTSTTITHLAPQTTYVLCVTCQAANPSREQCQVFSTLAEGGEGPEGSRWELAAGFWMVSSILLLVIAGVLLWGCLHSVCPLLGPAGCSRGSCTTSTTLCLPRPQPHPHHRRPHPQPQPLTNGRGTSPGFCPYDPSCSSSQEDSNSLHASGTENYCPPAHCRAEGPPELDQ